jgi:hypothetical protein
MRNVGGWGCRILTAAALLLTAGAAHGAGKSIFDDDWVPPKPVGPAGAAAADPAWKPPVADPTAKPASRLPVPDRAAQAAVRKTLREVFADQLADGSVAARRKLAQALLGQAAKSADAPVDRFVLLAAAVDAGVEGQSLPLAFKAADELGAAYDVDPLAVKAEKLGKFRPAPPGDASAISSEENWAAALDVADRLVAAEDFAAAARTLAGLQAAAGADAKARATVQRRLRDLGAAREAHGAAAKQAERLAANADDPAANLAVGRYRCFFKNDWAGGLPLLARGGDAKLKTLAAAELGGAAGGPDAMVQTADGWWSAHETLPAPAKGNVQAHAAKLYRQALPALKGLAKAKVEKRLEAVASAEAEGAGPWVEILGKMGAKPAQVRDGVVVLNANERLTTPETVRPPIAIKVVMQSGGDNGIGYAADEIIFNWANNPSELRIGGGPAGGRHKQGVGRIPTDTWVTIDVVVKKDSMTLSVDGEVRHQVNADFSAVNQNIRIWPDHSSMKVKSVRVQQLPP